MDERHAIESDGGRTYCLATSQYLNMVIGPNPAKVPH